MRIKENIHEHDCNCAKCMSNKKPEGAHYKTKLHQIIQNTFLINEIISDFDELPSWVQDKITIADHNMEAIIDYLETQLEMHYGYERLMDNPKFIELVDTNSMNTINEAEYRGRKVKLGKPFRTSGGPKKFSVYVKNKSGNIVKVNFGDPNLKIKNADPERAKSFRARHKCDQKKDRTTPGYWSCNVARYRKALGLTSSRTW